MIERVQSSPLNNFIQQKSFSMNKDLKDLESKEEDLTKENKNE
jgi:hypothetical protein